MHLIAALAYLVGALPTAYLLGRLLHRVDIRRHGSRNVGAVNAFRLFGWRIGVAVLLVDASKAAAVVLLSSALGMPAWASLGGALAVTIGHNWSLFLRFAGGKGVAVVFGLSLAVLPVLTLVTLPA